MGFRKIERALLKTLEGSFAKLSNKKGLIVLLIAFSMAALIFMKRRRRRSSTWIPDWYQKWESRQAIERQSWETPWEFHRRLMDSGTLSADQKEKLAELAMLVDLYSLKDQDSAQLRNRADELMKKIPG